MLPSLPAGAADALIADPPYNPGGPHQRRTDTARGKYVASYAAHTVAGHNCDQRAYGHWVSLPRTECLRTCPPGASGVYDPWVSYA